MMALEVGPRDDLVLPFDCPYCPPDEFGGDHEIVEMRRWTGDGEPDTGEGEWVHFFACATCERDLTNDLAGATGAAVQREEHRRGRG